MTDHDPQPAIRDPSFGAPDIMAEAIETVRAMTRALYPDARIPETPMPQEDPVAAKLDELRALLDATNLDTDTKCEIMVAAIHYGGERALAALDRVMIP